MRPICRRTNPSKGVLQRLRPTCQVGVVFMEHGCPAMAQQFRYLGVGDSVSKGVGGGHDGIGGSAAGGGTPGANGTDGLVGIAGLALFLNSN